VTVGIFGFWGGTVSYVNSVLEVTRNNHRLGHIIYVETRHGASGTMVPKALIDVSTAIINVSAI